MNSVAIDVTALVGERTGIGRAVEELVNALASLPDAPELCTYALGAPRHRRSAPAGARYVPFPTRLALAAWSRAERPRIDRFVRGAAVLHATNFVVPPSRLPTLVTVHDCSFALFPETVAPHVLAFGPVLRRALKRGAHVHTASEQVACEVEKLFAPGLRAQGRLHVVPFGRPAAGPPGGSTELPAGAPYVLALGRIEPRKNLPALVSAIGALPGVRLVIAGPDGAGRPALDAAVAALPAGDRARVLFTGSVDGRRKRALLAGARALAYPSVYEGFGFPVIEAMAEGTPVIASDIPVLREVSGGFASFVDASDPAAIAAAVQRLVGDEAYHRELATQGVARAAEFTWERTARGIVAIYRALSSSV